MKLSLSRSSSAAQHQRFHSQQGTVLPQPRVLEPRPHRLRWHVLCQTWLSSCCTPFLSEMLQVWLITSGQIDFSSGVYFWRGSATDFILRMGQVSQAWSTSLSQCLDAVAKQCFQGEGNPYYLVAQTILRSIPDARSRSSFGSALICSMVKT